MEWKTWNRHKRRLFKWRRILWFVRMYGRIAVWCVRRYALLLLLWLVFIDECSCRKKDSRVFEKEGGKDSNTDSDFVDSSSYIEGDYELGCLLESSNRSIKYHLLEESHNHSFQWRHLLLQSVGKHVACHSRISKPLRWWSRQNPVFNPIWLLVWVCTKYITNRYAWKVTREAHVFCCYWRLVFISFLCSIDRYHFSKIVKESKKGLKGFTALNDYYLHIQMRDIDNFPVILLQR